MEEMKLLTLDNPHSSISELYRRIRTNIEFASLDKKLKVVNVTSVNANETKTTTACNLAVMFAHKFEKVLLVDADLRKPSVHRLLKKKNMKGLADLMLDFAKNDYKIEAINIDKYIQTVEDDKLGNTLQVLTAGSRVNNPAEFVGSQTFKTLLSSLSQQYDMIIVDSAPSGIIVDGIVTSAVCDGTVFVIEYNRTTIDSAKNVIEQLRRDGANVLGGLLAKTPVMHRFFKRYYHDYSTYYSNRNEDDQNE